jgi:hypothetical protein
MLLTGSLPDTVTIRVTGAGSLSSDTTTVKPTGTIA